MVPTHTSQYSASTILLFFLVFVRGLQKLHFSYLLVVVYSVCFHSSGRMLSRSIIGWTPNQLSVR
jgi:hypothetical protein